MNIEIVIRGVGVRSPAGDTADTSSCYVLAQLSAVREHPFFVGCDGERISFAPVPTLPANMHGQERLLDLARPALQEALSGLSGGGRSMGLYVSLMPHRSAKAQGYRESLLARLREESERFSPVISAEMFIQGNSGALHALDKAVRDLRSGRVELALVGGVDSMIAPQWLTILDMLRKLRSQTRPKGLVPGEGAAFALLSRTPDPRTPNDPFVAGASIRGIGTAQEPSKRASDPPTGSGLSLALATALEGVSELHPVETVINDFSGVRTHADAQGFSLLRMGRLFSPDVDLCSPADCWGELGAATSAVLLAHAVSVGRILRWSERDLLVHATSDRGECAAVRLRLPGLV